MYKTHYKFTSIDSLRNFNKRLHKFYKDDLPTLTFSGTVKLHGTNAAIIYSPTYDTLYLQSRNRVLTLEEDNNGFVAGLTNGGDENTIRFLKKFAKAYFDRIDWPTDKPRQDYAVAIYGEWVGSGVQKNMAINELEEKQLVIFDVQFVPIFDKKPTRDEIDAGIKDGSWRVSDFNNYHNDSETPSNVLFSLDYQQYNITIDFSKFDQETLDGIQAYTKQVAESCPVARKLGLSGGGEGIVWRATTEGFNSSLFWFKEVREDMSVNSGRRPPKVYTEEELAQRSEQQAFIDRVLSERRYEQGIEFLGEMGKPLEMKSVGDFIRFVRTDVIKENADDMVAVGLNEKTIGKFVSYPSKVWFEKHLDSLIFNMDGKLEVGITIESGVEEEVKAIRKGSRYDS